MAAKILFTVAVVLCALAAATGGPIYHHDDSAEGLPHFDRPVMPKRKETTLNAGLKFSWDASEVLEKIQEAVLAVENKVQEVSEDVQNIAMAVVGDIEEAAVEVSRKWSEDVQKWAGEAAAAGVDVQDCVDQQETLSFHVADAIRSDARECAAKPLAGLSAALEDVKSVAPLADAVVDKAKAKVDECQEKGTLNSIRKCLFAGMPKIQIEAAKVVAAASLRAGVATAKAVSVGPVAALCTASATAHHAAEAKTIVNDAVSCIKNKLNA